MSTSASKSTITRGLHHLQSLVSHDGNYVIGRTSSLDKLFRCELGINLKRLSIPDNWSVELNKKFIANVIYDIISGKPAYACIDTSFAPNNNDLMTHFHLNFSSDPPAGKYVSMYAIEMSEILTIDPSIRHYTDCGSLKLFEIKKNENHQSTELTNNLKNLLNILMNLDIKQPTVIRTNPMLGGASKILIGSRWRSKRYIKVGKSKKLVVVKYNGLYVPVSFVEYMSKR